ncbi:MAG: methyl-accepting chemotaxis protein [Brevinematales bacterium]|nr:methyl-accepting chemotaxis protein [Brevinematales bacterium]
MGVRLGLWMSLLLGMMGVSWGMAFSASIPLLDNWRYTYGDNPLYAQEEYPDQEWKVVQFPTTTFSFEGEKEPYTWLRKRFFVPSSLSHQKLGLYTGRIHDSVEIYLNGVLIGISGSQPPNRYFGTPHTPRGFLLPPEVIRYGAENLLAIRVYTHKTLGAFGEMLIAPYHEVKERVRWETMLGLGIPQVVTIISLFMMVYFFFVFVGTRDMASLFVGFGVLCIGLYYTDIYVEYLPIDYLLKQKIAFSGLYLSFVFFVLFFHRFYHIKRKSLEVLSWILGVGSVVTNFLMPDFPTWELIMGSVVQLLWVLPVTLYMLGVNLVAFFQKKPYAWVMFLGTFCAIFFSLKDTFGFMLHIWARYWTSSWGMLLFSVSLFVAMALRTADIQKESQAKEDDLARQKSMLENLLTRMKGITQELGETSRQLDSEIISAKMAIEYVVDLSRQMREEFLHETKVLHESAMTTTSVIKDIENVIHRLGKENDLIQTGMGRFSGMVEGMQGIEVDIRSLREVIGTLKESVFVSRQETRASWEALQSLTVKADKVFELLGNIQKIADDTNTLAINAAIQSAHAGEYGKSFAIVGQEVRNLALSVAQLAESVSTEVQAMNKELTGTEGHFEVVDKGLQKTVDEIAGVEGLLERFQQILENQKRGSREVFETVGELNSVVEELVKSLGEQKERIQGFGHILQETEKLFQSLIQRLDSQREKEEKILIVMENLGQLSHHHKTLVGQLVEVASGS